MRPTSVSQVLEAVCKLVVGLGLAWFIMKQKNDTALAAGGAGWYFKIYRPKKQQATDAAEDYGDDYDDTPPWEDEDETESEGEE